MRAPTTDKPLDPAPPPHNVELEQALLGAILVNNDAYHHVSAFLEAQHFFEPLHQKLYEIAGGLIRIGKRADPITLKTFLPSDLEAAENMTAAQYLARLSAEATTVINAPDYGRSIHDLAQRRHMIEVGEALIAGANNTDHNQNHLALAASALEALGEIVTAAAERTGTMRTAGAAMAEFMDHAAAIYSGTVTDDSIQTGLRDLDARIGGLRRGSLVVLAGRPGMGKTTVAATIARNVARLNHGVAFFSLEMPGLQIMPRLLADELYDEVPLSVDRIARIKFNATDFDHMADAARAIERLPLMFDDAPSATVGTLLAKTQGVKNRFERSGRRLDLVLVDYLKFVRATDRYAGIRHYEVGEITAGLKQLARQLDCVVLLCAQLNRKTEDRAERRPQLADLRESGDLEADADLVLLLYREAYYLANDPQLNTDAAKLRRLEEVANVVEFIVAKNRHGPTDTVPAFINLQHSAVRDLQRQDALPFDRGAT
jgi:replicative DNA helicase